MTSKVNRRRFLQLGAAGSLSLAAAGFVKQTVFAKTPASQAADIKAPFELDKNPETLEKFVLDNKEWRKHLGELQYQVLRKEGTERPYTSPLNDEKREGEFVCSGCGLLLFTSETKYDSGTGWPSFYDGVAKHIGTSVDYKLLYPRTEYHCKRCGGHQGHVFKDGPKPTGLRYCNNGVSLRFIPSQA